MTNPVMDAYGGQAISNKTGTNIDPSQGTTPHPGDGALPFTGMELTGLALLGAVCLAAGLMLARKVRA